MRRFLVGWSCVPIGVLLLTGTALAQNDPFGQGLGGGGMGRPMPGGTTQPTQPAKPKKKPPPGTPELHAASGGSDSTIPQGSEPTLPEHPLVLSEKLQLRLGTDQTLDEPALGRGQHTDRDFYGLYYQEHSGDYQLKLAFPLWFERTQPSATDASKTDRASVYGSLYYQRRSAEHADDIVFPAFWNLRDRTSRTTIVGPLLNRVAPKETDNWFAPLYFFGTREHGSYEIIPPLLTYMNRDSEGGVKFVGPAFCFWEASDGCFSSPGKRDWGIAPLVFAGHDEQSSYRLIPPLLHYSAQDEATDSELTVWGPYYREHTEKRELFHILPFYWSIWGKDERHTTLFPFFHYGWEKNAELFISPLYLSATQDDGAKTFATWGYARYRGRTELDMYSPLVWLYRDPDAGLDQKLILPFWYSRTSPRENSWALFPFYGSFKRYGVSDSTWVTPLFNHEHSLTGWSTSLYPLAFFGRDRHESHSVLAPIFWDFAGPRSRSTVAFPLFWRFAEPDSLTQLVGNFLYTEKRSKRGEDWSFHILPALSFGETPDGHWWDFLFGLVGYERKGKTTRAKVFWAPITLSGGED